MPHIVMAAANSPLSGELKYLQQYAEASDDSLEAYLGETHIRNSALTARLMGNLTRNPEIRYTPSGTAVADLGLAINENFKNKAGETVEQTCFVDVVVWGRQAETSAEYLHNLAADGVISVNHQET